MLPPLTPPQLRVLGALAEKAATVPDTYPMTLKGLQTACNQKNSREPITDYDTFELQRTLDELKALGLVRFVYASHGARTTKYRHVLDEVLALDPASLALLTVLVLRGPQTVNELRTRTERAHTFDDNEQVVATLESLAARDEPLVVHLPRRTGQKETRWAHRLGDPDEPDVAPAATGSPALPTVAGAGPDVEARIDALEERVAALEAALSRLGPAPRPPEPAQEQQR